MMASRKRRVFKTFRRKYLRSIPSIVLPKDFSEEDYGPRLPELRKKYGQNKIYPKDLEIYCLLALSGYPQLSKTDITFKRKSTLFMMHSVPHYSFFWTKRKKRRYIVYINDSKGLFKGPLFDNLSLNGKVGGLAHELAHIIHYRKKSIFRMLRYSFMYIFSHFRRRIEWETDLEAINHGFGWQIYDFTHYILHEADTSGLYRSSKRKNYLDDEDILQYIKMLKK